MHRWLWVDKSKDYCEAHARVAIIGQCQTDTVQCSDVSSGFTDTRSPTRRDRTKQPRGICDGCESESDRLEFIFTDFTSPRSPSSGRMFGDEPEKVGSGSLSESEDLVDASLSAYDSDSGEDDGGNDVDSEDSDDEMRGTHGPGLMNLKFQLDAVKAGKHRNLHLMDPVVKYIASSEEHQRGRPG